MRPRGPSLLALVLFGSCAGLAMGLGALEAWCRATGRGRLQRAYTEGLEMRPTQFRPASDPLLGWEFDPKGYRANAAGVALNSRGFPDAERPLRKPAGTFRVAVLGDSITEQGWYVLELERLLNRSGLPARFEVWNWGVGGYSVTQYYHQLLDHVLASSPDLVIIGFCLNDFTPAPVVMRDASGAFVAFRNPFSDKTADVAAVRPLGSTRLLLLHSYAYRYLASALWLRAEPDPGDLALLGSRTLGRIQEEARSARVPVLAVIIPYLRDSYEEVHRSQYATMRAVLRERGLPTIDLHGAFPRPLARWRVRPDDFIHPSEEGHRLIARRIYERLMRDRGAWFGR